MNPIKVITIGAGSRGNTYSNYCKENLHQFQIVGVAEPHTIRRETFCKEHNIAQENCLHTWEHVFDRPKWADAVLICTQDNMHYGPAMAAIAQGYHILLEKPVSPSEAECFEIASAAEAAGVKVVVCHTMRYSPFFQKLKELLDGGIIGDIVSFAHLENVGNIHYSHSFVRGHWRNSVESSPMILAKSCHDMDMLQWLIGKKCIAVSSFGSQKYFNSKNCPPSAPPRCTDGCGVDCPYDARKIYLQQPEHAWMRTPAVGHANPTDEDVEAALKTGPYGKCVFQTDNNVVDNQVTNMLFEDDVTVMFSMCGHTREISRSLKIMGTKGQLRAHTAYGSIYVYDFLTCTETEIFPDEKEGGHGGGDVGIMETFYQYLHDEIGKDQVSEAGISAQNHRLCFAAEESRVNGGKLITL